MDACMTWTFHRTLFTCGNMAVTIMGNASGLVASQAQPLAPVELANARMHTSTECTYPGGLAEWLLYTAPVLCCAQEPGRQPDKH